MPDNTTILLTSTRNGAVHIFTQGLDSGWLCFEAPSEKRRLTPIPHDWQSCGVDCLEKYCAQAKVARRISGAIDVVNVDDN